MKPEPVLAKRPAGAPRHPPDDPAAAGRAGAAGRGHGTTALQASRAPALQAPHCPDAGGRVPQTCSGTLRITLPATETGVRRGLAQVFAALRQGVLAGAVARDAAQGQAGAAEPVPQVPQSACDRIELVLAEALNNIVEHAFGPEPPAPATESRGVTAPGLIALDLSAGAAQLHCTIRDAGRPMPDGQAPAGRPQDIDAAADLPEGGFGWFLIRRLTLDLCYVREPGCNRLSFVIPLSAEDPPRPHGL